MPSFEIETEERVRGVYHVTADDESQARRMFANGQVTKTSVYEAIDAEIKEVREVA